MNGTGIIESYIKLFLTFLFGLDLEFGLIKEARFHFKIESLLILAYSIAPGQLNFQLVFVHHT